MIVTGCYGSKAASESYSSPAAAFGGKADTRHSTPAAAFGQERSLAVSFPNLQRFFIGDSELLINELLKT
jgi:hypothetical protein